MYTDCLSNASIRPAPDFGQFRKTLLRQGRPAYVPFYELGVSGGVIETLTGRRPDTQADVVQFYYRAGYDYVPVGLYLPFIEGTLRDSSKGYPVRNRADYAGYRWPAWDPAILEALDKVAAVLPEGMKIVGQTNGIYEHVASIVGYENLCYLLTDDRPLIEELFTGVGELYVMLYGGMAQHEAVGALVISDDLGYKTQTLIAPDDLRELVLPWHKKFAALAHAANKPCILHSCGHLSSIMEDIIEAVRIDAKHSYEDAILPVTEAKRLYGSRITILGGFDLDRLCRSTADEVRLYTRMLIEECGANGGYALGSGNSIADYVPAANYLAMLDEGWKSRRNNSV